MSSLQRLAFSLFNTNVPHRQEQRGSILESTVTAEEIEAKNSVLKARNTASR